MPILEFSRAQLTKKLDQLPRSLRVTFAATCAERLLPAYLNFSDMTERAEPETLTRILTRLWDDIAGNLMEESELQKNISTCMSLIPPDDDMTLPIESDYAENAVLAVIYALTCRQGGNSQEAMSSAEQVYNALDHFLINRENIVLRRRESVRRILAHPLIQAELARQRRDIEELLGAAEADADVRQTAERFQERAKAESGIVFGVPS
jgi:hypothetical protein